MAMLNIDQNVRERILVVSPDGALTQDDFRRLSEAIDAIATSGQKVRGIVIHSREFPGWANSRALRDHLKLIRLRHRQIVRVAVASDSPILRTLPRMAGFVLAPEVRVFRFDEMEPARGWAAGADQ
jgi:hypothetical protein